MASVVLDASVIVKLLVDEPGSTLSKAVFEAYDHAGASFLMPAHAPVEVMEVLRRKFTSGMASRAQLDQAATVLPSLAEIVPLPPLLAAGMSITLDHGITLYDALYVTLSDQRGSLLLTADIRLVDRLRATPFGDIALGIHESRLVFHGRS